MIINFKYAQYDDILDEYQVLFRQDEPLATEEQDGNILVVNRERVVFPQLHASFREAAWYSRNNSVKDPESSEAWDAQASVYVLYEENEKDINRYISYMTGFFDYSIADVCKREGYPDSDRYDLDCYIDTSEFIDDKKAKRLLSTEWKKGIIAKYPEFFDAIKGLSYKMKKGGYYDAEVSVFGDENSFEVYLGKKYWYCFFQLYTRNSEKEPDQDAVYKEIVSFTKALVNNKIFVVFCFVNGRIIVKTTYSMDDSNRTARRIFEDLKKDYPELQQTGQRICIRKCFWEEPITRGEEFIS